MYPFKKDDKKTTPKDIETGTPYTETSAGHYRQTQNYSPAPKDIETGTPYTETSTGHYRQPQNIVLLQLEYLLTLRKGGEDKRPSHTRVDSRERDYKLS